MAGKNKKTLKVYGKYNKSFRPTAINPEIRLTGKWVKEWGFNHGNLVLVRNIEKGVMIINEIGQVPPTIYL